MTSHELEDDLVDQFFDIVQDTVDAKILKAYTRDKDTVEIEVIVYESPNGIIYEVALEEHIDVDEGQDISKQLAQKIDIDFEFEISQEL